MNKTWRNLAVFVLLVIIVFFGRGYITPASTPTPTVAPSVQGATAQTDSGGYFTAYFTNPPLNADTPGIETNLIRLIGNAKVSVHGAFFEMDLEDVTQALIAAKARGVDVGLVYDDDQMTDPDRVQILADLKSAGIPLVPDKRSAFMHNKFFIIDGKTVWTGSFNYTGNAAHKNNENAVVFNVPQLAANYEKEFSEMFAGKFGPKNPADTPYPEFTTDGVVIDNYFAPEDHVMPKVIAEVKSARDSVDFLSFSFTDTDLGYTMTELAMEQDVTVRGVFESSQSSGSVCSYMIERNKNIQGSGHINVKLDGNPATMHEKVIVIDGTTVIFGSFNFSKNADQSNDENLLIVHDPRLAALFEAEFQKVYDKGVTPVDGCKKP